VDVKADKLAPFGEIIRLNDALKAAKEGSINFMTEKQATP
jgi:biopolymer transport protein ExbD